MARHCQRPCPAVRANPGEREALCAHLLDGASCIDAWLALAAVVTVPRQRLDCYERAHALAPDDLDVRIGLLEARLTVSPDDPATEGELRELRARRAITGHVPFAWRPRDPAPSLGELLVGEQVLSEAELRRTLQVQRARNAAGKRALLGDLLVERGIVTPAALVRILMRQFRERRLRGESAYSVGEYLVIVGAITEEQLSRALLEQTRLRQAGRSEPIGKILVRAGVVDVAALQNAIEQLDDHAMRSMV
jgi:hypothetical protein